MSLDPTVGQFFGAAVGAAITSAVAVAHARWKREAKRRPLYENGQREEIVKMFQEMRRRFVSNEDAQARLEDRLALLERDAQEGVRIHRRIAQRLGLLEDKQGPQP